MMDAVECTTLSLDDRSRCLVEENGNVYFFHLLHLEPYVGYLKVGENVMAFYLKNEVQDTLFF